jgi:hypothetical protein
MKNTSNYMPKCIALFAIILFGQLNLFGQTGETPWYVDGNTQGGDMKFGRQYSEAGNIYFFNSATASEADYDMVLTYDPSYLGIGTLNPTSDLHIHSDATYTGTGTGTGDLDPTRDVLTLTSESKLQLTNINCGAGENDGFLIRSYNNNVVLNHQESGSFTLINNGLGLRLEENGNISVGDNSNAYFSVNTDGNVGIGTDEPVAKLEVKGILSDFNYLIGLEQGYGIFSDNIGNGIGGETRLWFNTPNNGSIVFGPRSSENNLNNIRFRAQKSRFEGNLEVVGSATVCQIVVEPIGWCDYVFEDDYELMELSDLELFVKSNKHLPDVPSEAEIFESGIDVAEMNMMLLEKVEELTLYIIQLQKEVEALKSTNN